ncbi:hypothetical protein RhiirB3_420202, partial [Rhizophagus irregularis]
MKECWDADPLKRPDAGALWKRMKRFNLDYQNMSDELYKSKMDNLGMNKVEENYKSSRLFTSKIHNFGIYLNQEMQQKKNKKTFH